MSSATVGSIWSIAWFNSDISLLNFYMDDLSIGDSGYWKHPLLLHWGLPLTLCAVV
jgi:hypothetical protein